MKWLAECSAAALQEALPAVAPELSSCPVTVPVPDPAAKADPLWWSSSAAVGERFIAKFAWSRPAAPDHRTPPEWVDDVAARFSALGINPRHQP